MAQKVLEKADIQLVEAARDGDLKSFGLLYMRHYPSIVGIAYSVVADRHLAEDAAQETFAIACRDLIRLRRRNNFGGWLRGICRNVAKQMLRRQVRKVSGPNVASQVRGNPEEGVEDAVRQAVAQLKTLDREAVILHYFSGMPHEQIAATLGISPQAVHGRLTRARRKIGRILTRKGWNIGRP